MTRMSQAGTDINSLCIWGVKETPDRSRVLFVYATMVRKDMPNFYEDVVLRGNSVGMMLRISTEGGVYAVLVRQHRGPMGGDIFELPAGMVEDGYFRGVAAKEIKQETGISVPERLFVPLDCPCMTSPGIIDELMQLYLVDMHMPHAQLESFKGFSGGLAVENEATKVIIVPWADAKKREWGGKDMKFRLAYAESNLIPIPRRAA